jgi:hypothetical protein
MLSSSYLICTNSMIRETLHQLKAVKTNSRRMHLLHVAFLPRYYGEQVMFFKERAYGEQVLEKALMGQKRKFGYL